MKKPRTKASIIKWVLLSILAVILIAALVIFFYVKYKIFPKIDGYMNDPEIVSMLEELQQEDLSGILESIDGVVPETTQAPVESPLPTETAPATQAPISQTDVLMPPAPSKAPTPEPTKAPAKTATSRMEELKSQIPAADMAAATALASKVSPGYILGLLSGGLTAEEKRELKAYLTSRLSGAEISKGISLYNKYSYLLR